MVSYLQAYDYISFPGLRGYVKVDIGGPLGHEYLQYLGITSAWGLCTDLVGTASESGAVYLPPGIVWT